MFPRSAACYCLFGGKICFQNSPYCMILRIPGPQCAQPLPCLPQAPGVQTDITIPKYSVSLKRPPLGSLGSLSVLALQLHVHSRMLPYASIFIAVPAHWWLPLIWPFLRSQGKLQSLPVLQGRFCNWVMGICIKRTSCYFPEAMLRGVLSHSIVWGLCSILLPQCSSYPLLLISCSLGSLPSGNDQ